MAQAGIGEMVHEMDISHMTNFISKHGESAFIDAVWNGAFAEVAYAYIHPCDEMRSTSMFSEIQKAFINAYV